MYTTGEYLLQARKITDLVVHSDERSVLWKSLRERANQPQAQDSEMDAGMLDPQITEWLGYLYLQTKNEKIGGSNVHSD